MVYLPLWKNMKVKWDDYSQDMEKTNVPNHQSDFKHGVMCLAVLPPGSPQRRREACACPVPVAFQRASAHPLDKYPNLSWAAYAIFSSIFPKKMLGQFTSIPILLSEILYFKKKKRSSSDPTQIHYPDIVSDIKSGSIYAWHLFSDILSDNIWHSGIYSDIKSLTFYLASILTHLTKKSNNPHLTGVEKHPSRKAGASPETPSLSCPTSQPSRQRDPLHPGDVENLIQKAVLWPKKMNI